MQTSVLFVALFSSYNFEIRTFKIWSAVAAHTHFEDLVGGWGGWRFKVSVVCSPL